MLLFLLLDYRKCFYFYYWTIENVIIFITGLQKMLLFLLLDYRKCYYFYYWTTENVIIFITGL